MAVVGVSSGAVALGDFVRGVEIARNRGLLAVEVSALRYDELAPLCDAWNALDLHPFQYVSIHAPSFIRPTDEPEVIARLRRFADTGVPIIVHPDIIQDWPAWNSLGPAVCIENLDSRKTCGRFTHELNEVFYRLPSAQFCFDIAHARELDPSMGEAWLILHTFGDRLVQVHISELDAACKHSAISAQAVNDFRPIVDAIPNNTPFIIESVVDERGLDIEVRTIRDLVPSHPLPRAANLE